MAKKTTVSDSPVTTEQTDQRRERRLVDLDPDLARKIGMLAGFLGISVPDYVNSRLAPIVDEEGPRIVKQSGWDQGSSKGEHEE